jgi:RNA polymerase sigma-70 factor (ECF subfamily)
VADPDATERFGALYAEHYRRVYAYAVSRVGRQLADEVTSEVFLIAWRRLADVPRPALPWLLTVARNTASSQFRAAARQQSAAAELRAWVSEAALAEPDVADQACERVAVLTALAVLPESDRELLTLVAWHGLTPAEAAQVIGCSPATYFVRLHRARRRLQRVMDGQPGHPVRPGPAGHATTDPAAPSPSPGYDRPAPAERSDPHEQVGGRNALRPPAGDDGGAGQSPPGQPGPARPGLRHNPASAGRTPGGKPAR